MRKVSASGKTGVSGFEFELRVERQATDHPQGSPS